MLLHRMLTMRLIRGIVSLLTILDEVEDLRLTLFGVDELRDQLSRLRGGQGR